MPLSLGAREARNSCRMCTIRIDRHAARKHTLKRMNQREGLTVPHLGSHVISYHR